MHGCKVSFLLLLLPSQLLWCQSIQYKTAVEKPVLSTNVFTKWTAVQQPSLSADGNYVLYTVYNDPVGTNNKRYVIQSANSKWKQEYLSASSAEFSPDGKFAIIQLKSDTLQIVSLGSDTIKRFPELKVIN